MVEEAGTRRVSELPYYADSVDDIERTFGRSSLLSDQLYRARRVREVMLSEVEFGEPAWDILLTLYTAAKEGRRLSVSKLSIAAAVPTTTALRWQMMMVEKGLLLRRADPDDRRRAFVELSPSLLSRLDTYMGWLGTKF